jgi:hypothetical protein
MGGHAVKAIRFTLGVLVVMAMAVAHPVSAAVNGTWRAASGEVCIATARQVLGPRSAAIVWARGHGALSMTEVPPSDGQSHYLLDLDGGSLELIGPEPALQRVSWMGDPSESREWSSFLDRYAAGQTGFVTDVLADTTSETPDESVDLADRTLRVMAIRASAGTLLVLAVKDATDRGTDASDGSSSGLGDLTSGTACEVAA